MEFSGRIIRSTKALCESELGDCLYEYMASTDMVNEHKAGTKSGQSWSLLRNNNGIVIGEPVALNAFVSE